MSFWDFSCVMLLFSVSSREKFIVLVRCSWTFVTRIKLLIFNWMKLYESRGGTSDFRLPTSDFRLQTSDFRLQTSDFRLQTSDFRLQTSDFRLQTSDFRFQTSDFRLQNLKHRSSTRRTQNMDRGPWTTPKFQKEIAPVNFKWKFTGEFWEWKTDSYLLHTSLRVCLVKAGCFGIVPGINGETTNSFWDTEGLVYFYPQHFHPMDQVHGVVHGPRPMFCIRPFSTYSLFSRKSSQT